MINLWIKKFKPIWWLIAPWKPLINSIYEILIFASKTDNKDSPKVPESESGELIEFPASLTEGNIEPTSFKWTFK